MDTRSDPRFEQTRIENLPIESKRRLCGIARTMLVEAGLIGKSYTYDFEFDKRDSAVYSQYKLALLVAKEARRRLPFLATNRHFFQVDRSSVRLYVARDPEVIKRYVNKIKAKLYESHAELVSLSVESDVIFSGFNVVAKPTIVVMRFSEVPRGDILSSSPNSLVGPDGYKSVNPYRIFLHLEDILQFITALAKYSYSVKTLSQEELDRLRAVQNEFSSGRLSYQTSVPIDIPVAIEPMYRTARMRRKNEHITYSSYNSA